MLRAPTKEELSLGEKIARLRESVKNTPLAAHVEELLQFLAPADKHDARETTIQITVGEVPLPPCFDEALQELGCLNGRVVVEMAEHPITLGAIALPDELAANLRPDVATVLAVGSDIPDLEPGDLVLVQPYDGTWRHEFRAGSYTAKGQVRCYGVFIAWGCPDSKQKRAPWWESIPAKISQDMKSIQPLKDWVLVRRDPILGSERGILLTADSEYRTNAGTVIAVGPGLIKNVDGKDVFMPTFVKPGDRVVYHPWAPLELDMKAIAGDKDLALMQEDGIEMVLTGGETVTGMKTRGARAIMAA